MTGPRSALEIRAARHQGARIISLIADVDPKIDRNIRLDRATKPRVQAGAAVRVMTKEDFLARERQEYRRIRRLMNMADRTVVNNGDVRLVVREMR